MNQVREAATSRKVTIGICMALTMLAVPISAGLLLSRTASALSLPLLDKTTGLVTQALSDTTDSLLSSPPSRQSTPANDTVASRRATTSSTHASQSSSTLAAPHADQSAGLVTSTVTPLATIAPLDTTRLANLMSTEATSSRSARLLAVDQPARTVAADSSPFLQPTERGWRLFGLLWYWWLFGLMLASMGLYIYVHRLILRTSL